MEKGFLPETLLNGVALLGWNPPHREDPSVVSSSINTFMKNEVLDIKDIFGTVRYIFSLFFFSLT
jgi:hypothetical protein